MFKELLKYVIIGLSIIISVFIYTESNKYELVDNRTDFGLLDYYLINKKTGEVFLVQNYSNTGPTRYRINLDGDIVKEKILLIENP